MKILIVLGVIVFIVVLTKYYSVILKRMVSVAAPVVVPLWKKFYAGFVKLDEQIAGTDRKATGTAYNKSDRYVDVKNPYKHVSIVIVAMLMSVLTLYINKWYGLLLLVFWFICLVFDIVMLPFRKKLAETKAGKLLKSCLIQLAIAIVLVAFFNTQVRDIIKAVMNCIKVK